MLHMFHVKHVQQKRLKLREFSNELVLEIGASVSRETLAPITGKISIFFRTSSSFTSMAMFHVKHCR